MTSDDLRHMLSPDDLTDAELYLGRIGMKMAANGLIYSIEPFEATDVGPGFIIHHEGKVLGFATDSNAGVHYIDHTNDGHINPGEPTIDYIQSVRDAR